MEEKLHGAVRDEDDEDQLFFGVHQLLLLSEPLAVQSSRARGRRAVGRRGHHDRMQHARERHGASAYPHPPPPASPLFRTTQSKLRPVHRHPEPKQDFCSLHPHSTGCASRIASAANKRFKHHESCARIATQPCSAPAHLLTPLSCLCAAG
eukprot:2202714-Rhodomonas_salina.1